MSSFIMAQQPEIPLTETAQQGQTYERQLDLLKTASTQSPHPLHAHDL